MRGKKLLAVFHKRKARFIDIALLKATVNYMMFNHARFLAVNLFYDPTGAQGKAAKLPVDVDTKGKILVMVQDNRRIWSDKSGIPLEVPLLDDFRMELETIHSFIAMWTTDMDTDVVAGFYTQQQKLLGYFYQGEYHLWKK